MIIEPENSEVDRLRAALAAARTELEAIKSARSLHGIGSVKQLMDANSELIGANARLDAELAAARREIKRPTVRQKTTDDFLVTTTRGYEEYERENERLKEALRRIAEYNGPRTFSGGPGIVIEAGVDYLQKIAKAALCFEDICCCLDSESEHGFIPCPDCNPRGKK